MMLHSERPEDDKKLASSGRKAWRKSDHLHLQTAPFRAENTTHAYSIAYFSTICNLRSASRRGAFLLLSAVIQWAYYHIPERRPRHGRRASHHPDAGYSGALPERRRPQDRRAVREAGHPDPQRPALPLSPPVSGLFQTLFHRGSPCRYRVCRKGRGVCQAGRTHPARRASDGAHHRRG